MKNRLLNLFLVLLMVCSFSSCSLFGYDLQEDYDYEHTPGNAYLEQTAYGFIQSRKDIDMGILYQAIERVGFKEEYEASDRTFIVMNDVAFVAYFQTKKYAGLENMSDKDIKDLLNSLMLEEAVTSLDLTINPVAMSPINKDARYLCADALEQLGYQAESGAWRNAYLTGAYELRNGTKNYPNSEGSGATALGMSTETMLDYLGICLDEKKLEDQNLVINLEVTDKNAKYLLRINHGVLIYSQEKWSDKADATIKTKSAGILGIAQNNQKLMDAGIEKVEGNSDIIKTLTSSVAEFPLYFNIIEP